MTAFRHTLHFFRFSRHARHVTWVLVILLVMAARPVAGAVNERARPNVVIFLSDDQGWGDLSINGNKNLATPNIDSIGRGGAVFDQFYVCAVCSPTRAEFLTGRYHSRGGVTGTSRGEERLDLDERTIAEAFKAAGYATGAFGKWHNGSQWPYHPNARGFDEFHGFTSGHWAEYSDPLLEHNGEPVRGKGYIADVFTDHALKFIDENQSRPFFCYVPYNTPHSPFDVPAEDWTRSRDRPVPMRAAGGDEDLTVTRCVLEMCENLDRNVGRVLRRLEELGLAENTIVIYFNDNGPNSFRWNGGMKGRKGSVDEGGLRSAFLIRWPARIKPGTVIPRIAGAIDLLPTLTAMAGIPRVGSKPLDGVDVSPLLLGQGEGWKDRRIFSQHNGRVSVRTQEYRLDPAGALFNIADDPGQGRDVAADHPDIAEELRAVVSKWRADVLGSDFDAKAGRTGDDRPYTVGYPEFPRTNLPARDGVAHGGVQRSSRSPNSSYFTGWKSREGFITWDVDVHTMGEYDVAMLYTCPASDVGSTIELSFRGAKVAGKVGPAWDPPFYRPYTIPRPAPELLPKEFRTMRLGTIRLERGRGPLTLRALDIPGASVMELRQVVLTLHK